MATLLSEEWTGSLGYVLYGDNMFFVENWSIVIEGGTTDLTNISIYPSANPQPRGGTPEEPYRVKNPFSALDKIANYGAGRLNYFTNLRKANISASGFAASSYKQPQGDWDVYFPRIGNTVRLEFASRKNKQTTIFVFPEVVITNINFKFNIKDYNKYDFTGVSNGEFDVFPGPNDVGR